MKHSLNWPFWRKIQDWKIWSIQYFSLFILRSFQIYTKVSNNSTIGSLSYNLLSASLNVNILHDCSTITKTRKITSGTVLLPNLQFFTQTPSTALIMFFSCPRPHCIYLPCLLSPPPIWIWNIFKAGHFHYFNGDNNRTICFKAFCICHIEFKNYITIWCPED